MQVYVMLGKDNAFKGVFKSVGNAFTFLESKNLHPYNTEPIAGGISILCMNDEDAKYVAHLFVHNI